MDKIKSKKIALVAFTGALAVSTMAVAFTFKEPTLPIKSTNQRVVTINHANRYLDVYKNNARNYTDILFKLDDKYAYHKMYTSQSQYDVWRNKNECIAAMWCGGEVQLFINIEVNNSDTYSFNPDGSNPISLVYFNRLTRVDFTLDKGKGTDRMLTFNTVVNDTKGREGLLETLEETSTYIKYKWTPNNEAGYITSNERLKIWKEANSDYSGRAIWLTELTFYYDC